MAHPQELNNNPITSEAPAWNVPNCPSSKHGKPALARSVSEIPTTHVPASIFYPEHYSSNDWVLFTFLFNHVQLVV